ncbi:MAG: hypothetical protein CMM59_23185, partial [Rhodospirillaceae bacterium]|nr:hypothetical protein [Rhodospirillaceae bacterium]
MPTAEADHRPVPISCSPRCVTGSKRLSKSKLPHRKSPIGKADIVACGTAYEESLAFSEKISCHLIVLGSHRPKAQDFFLGPNSARIVRHAN